MRRFFFLFFSLFLLPCLATAQTTTITLQVTDAGAQSWNNGTWSVTLVSLPGAVNFGPPFYNIGTTTLVPNQTQNGALSGTGSATITLTQTASISPANSRWSFQVCSQATATNNCFVQAVAITTVTTLTLTPPTLTVNSGPGALAYADSEIVTPGIGATYYNLTLNQGRVCNGPIPCTFASGGSGSVSGQVVNQIPLGTTATTITGTLANPTTPNGVTFTLCDPVSGGVSIPTTCWPGITVTSQTTQGGTNAYTIAAADRGTCIEENNSVAETYTIPDVGGINFQFGFNFCVINIGTASGAITVNNTSSSKFNLFGAQTGSLKTTFTLFIGQTAYFYSSPTSNWDVVVAGGYIQTTSVALTTSPPPLAAVGTNQFGWAQCYNPGPNFICMGTESQQEFHAISANGWWSFANSAAAGNAGGAAPDTASYSALPEGISGGLYGKEGTCSSYTNNSGAMMLCPDSTAHEILVNTNGDSMASHTGMLVRRQPVPISLTAQSASVTNGTVLCAASAGACNIAGQYRVTAYFDTTTSGTGNIVFNLTWTDETGTHTAQTVPMDVAGATSLTGNMPLTAANNATATTSFWSTGASQIGYGIVYTSTGSYAARITVERLQ